MSNQAYNHTSQHITGASNGHSGITCGVNIRNDSIGNNRPVAFENNHCSQLQSKGFCSRQPVPIEWHQSFELPFVGCQNRCTFSSTQYIFMRSEHIYAIGIL